MRFMDVMMIADVVDSDRDVTTRRARIPGTRSNNRRSECFWFRDYLSTDPICKALQFRRRFNVPLKLFLKLEHDLLVVEPQLRRLVNARGRQGASTWQ